MRNKQILHKLSKVRHAAQAMGIRRRKDDLCIGDNGGNKNNENTTFVKKLHIVAESISCNKVVYF